MALASAQTIIDQDIKYVVPFQTERGGILSIATVSGVEHAVYEQNPTEQTVILGLQQHDTEEVDLFRAVAPWRTHRAFAECTPYPYLILGEVVTNAIHPDIDPLMVRPGAPIYLAPSGLMTCVPTYNSQQIGTFQSSLNDPSLLVPATLGPSVLRVAGTEAIVNPDSVYVNTAGWAKIRIHIR